MRQVEQNFDWAFGLPFSSPALIPRFDSAQITLRCEKMSFPDWDELILHHGNEFAGSWRV